VHAVPATRAAVVFIYLFAYLFHLFYLPGRSNTSSPKYKCNVYGATYSSLGGYATRHEEKEKK